MSRIFENYVLLKLLVASVLIVTLCCFCGPYNYAFGSMEALAYYYASMLLFAVPLLFCGKKNRDVVEKRQKGGMSISLRGELLLSVFAVIGALASLVFVIECVRVLSIDVLFSEADYRGEFGIARTPLSKVAEIVSYLGPAVFMIASAFKPYKSKGVMPLAYISLIACGVSGLVLGARWKMFVCVILLVLSMVFSRNRIRVSEDAKRWMKRLAVLVLILIIVDRFMVLFEVRGLNTAETLFRFTPGDMSLTPWAQNVYAATNGSVNAFFKAIDYIGQAPFVFTIIFDNYMPDHLYYGAFTLRPVGYVLSVVFGLLVPLQSDIAMQTFTGAYSGSAYYLIVDFGVYGALVASFLSGCMVAAVERRRFTAGFCKMVFPLVATVVTCSPVYYLYNVGGADWMFAWVVVLWTLFKLLGVLVRVNLRQRLIGPKEVVRKR